MNKYNEWCHRKPLISNSDFTDFANKSAKINFHNISRFSKAALQQHEFLKINGIEFIDKKIYDIKKLAVNYVLSILYKCDINYPNEKLHASFGTDFENSFLSNASMYKGPTHMALKYFTMI